ncbi:unnamed protein product [Nippostrongylus brasiliensis]|uniref:Ig-like domain-containing protein n=1 Tax=Nippostrongylus brasiliensis TaxID=27835 RepID=A0A158R2P7_NIPBR|nr:unnamed protein product [Nippostrongylus brasiliensis]
MLHLFCCILMMRHIAWGRSSGSSQPPSCRRYSYSNRPSQDCSSQNLSALPALFNDVIALNLANNSIPTIERFPRNYGNLHTLRLDNCGIKKISVQAISTLTNVRVLDLSGNQLKSITFGPKAYTITTLNLARNHLKFMPDLSGLLALRYLDLSHNEITNVKHSYLPANVESLRLTANQITHLTPWPFLRKLQGASERRLEDSGRIEFCLAINSVAIEDLGFYTCFAQLEYTVASKQFQLIRAREPLVLKSPPNIIFYCQFSIGLFIFLQAFCCATCCILRRGRPTKTGPKKDNHYRTQSFVCRQAAEWYKYRIGINSASTIPRVVHVMADKDSGELTTTPSYYDNHERYLSADTVDYCTDECHWDAAGVEDCMAPSYPYINTRRCLQPEVDDAVQRRISLWRHRIAAMPAPLAQFDKETNIMGIVNTAV